MYYYDYTAYCFSVHINGGSYYLRQVDSGLYINVENGKLVFGGGNPCRHSGRFFVERCGGKGFSFKVNISLTRNILILHLIFDAKLLFVN